MVEQLEPAVENNNARLDKAIFLGFSISEKKFEKLTKIDNFPAVQTLNYANGLLKCLSKVYDLTIISAQPASDFPHCNKVIFRGGRDSLRIEGKEVKVKEIFFINLGLIKVLTRFLSALSSCVKALVGSEHKCIVVYSVHVPFMLCAYFVSRFFRLELVAVWTDPPSVINKRDGGVKRRLRALERKLSIWLMSRFDKVIVIAERLAIDFSPNKPYLVLESITKEYPIRKVGIKNKRDVVLYSGTLDERYGIKNLLDAVSLIDSDFELKIYGRGDYEEKVKEASSLDPRIIYYGFADRNLVLAEQRKADLLINTRSALDEYVSYSFPSKVTEYLQSGTPLVTTMLPGMPSEYKDYIIEIEDNTAESIADGIRYGFSLSYEHRLSLGVKAQDFMLTKNAENQTDKLYKFLRKY